MLFLSERLLTAAGFKYDQMGETWVAPVRPAPVATVECDQPGDYVTESILEVHGVLEAADFTYRNFAIRSGYLSLVGLTRALVAAVA
jgi:hypothetical protein